MRALSRRPLTADVVGEFSTVNHDLNSSRAPLPVALPLAQALQEKTHMRRHACRLAAISTIANLLLAAPAAYAVDITAGDWKLALSGLERELLLARA